MRQLSSLTFLMFSEFSEIVKVIFLPANSLWSRPPKKLYSGIFSVLLDPCECGFCCRAVSIVILLPFSLSLTILIQMLLCLSQS